MKKNKIKWVLGFLLLLFSNAWSQQYNFATYSFDKGLSQSTILDIFQDSRGIIWVGTAGGGICKFDGSAFKSFNKSDGLYGNTVRSIIEDNDGVLWLGTDKGIFIYNGKTFKRLNFDKLKDEKTVYKLFKDKSNNIWASYLEIGLVKFKNRDDSNPIIYSANEGLGSNYIFDIYENKSSELILATIGGGVNILNTNTKKINIISIEDGLPSANINCIEKDSNGNIWFGTMNSKPFYINSEVISSTDFKVSDVNILNDFPDNYTWDIIADNNTIYFATDKSGVLNLTANKLSAYHTTNGLPNNQIIKLLVDNNNNLWIGTFGSGLCKFTGPRFSHLTIKDGLANEQVYNIVEDKDHNYWLATLGGGLSKLSFDNQQKLRIKNYTTKDGLPDNYLTSLCLDNKNNLWVGTKDNGVCYFSGKSFIKVDKNSGLKDNKVNAINIDKTSKVWVATSSGIARMDKDKVDYLTEENALKNNEVQSIINDIEGNVWIATFGGGLAKFDGTDLHNFDEEEGLLEKRINCLSFNNGFDILAIGTFGDGIYICNNPNGKRPRFEKLVNQKYLSSENIYGITFTNSNTIMAATDRGVDLITLENNKFKSVQTFNSADGFTGVENNLNSILNDSKGNTWFGTVHGVTIFNPTYNLLNKIPPQINITDFQINFNSVDWSKRNYNQTQWFTMPNNFELSYSENHIGIAYKAINYNNPAKVRYRYMLEGSDKSWSPILSTTEVTYSSLLPGNYKFKVKACNEDGVWNPEPLIISFTILSPFYFTWWFISLCIAIVILGILFYVKWRVKSLKKKQRELEVVVISRTAEVVHQKELIEEKNHEITDSIKYALEIQQAILPPNNFINENLHDYFILYKPKDIVSGDFYWMETIQLDNDKVASTLSTNQQVIFATCDCTGHGVPGAMVSLVGYINLNRTVHEFEITQPAAILDKLSKLVEETFERSEREVKDGMDISMCLLNPETLMLEWAGANNPLWIMRNNELIVVKANKQPIGKYANRVPFTNHSIQLIKGDCFYLFTDGFADQFGANGKKLKIKPFKDLIIQIHHKPMAEQQIELNNFIENWKGNTEQTDDILVFGNRV